jgi:hypothetical protein
MSNLDQSGTLTPTDYSYPIAAIEIRQGFTDPIFVIQIKDSDNATNLNPLDPAKFVGSIAVAKPTGTEVSTAAQLEFVGDSDGTTIFAHVPTAFSNGLNPMINRPVKTVFDIWQTDNGIDPVGGGIVGGTIMVRERVTLNDRVGSSNVSTK